MAGQFINAPSPSRREARNFENELDIVIVGNKSDKNVTSGQYVTVRDSTITGITDGIYKATANVAAGTAFVAANLSAVTSGALNDLYGNLATNKIKAIAVSANVTCGNAVAHFPGSGTANVGLGTVNFINDVPSGGTFFALIPGQATRASGVDVAYSIVPDNSASSIRIYGTANQTYAVTATLLYF